MPRAPLHALIWSSEQGLYELNTQGQVVRRFHPTEEAAWLAWLGEVTSLAFHSPSGSLNVYRERRPRGGRYWYAYHTDRDGIRKRYLGQTAQVTLARLEEMAQALSSASPPPPLAALPARRAVEPPLLLSTKLAPPRLPNALVVRERLLSLLDGTLSTPLTLLSAPAGWGKTTLLSAWARQYQGQVAWLSLDELDNSPTRFWVGLIAALGGSGRYRPRLGETAVALLQSPQPPPLSSILTTLLQELESGEADPAPLVLVLDDYQVIEEPSIHQGMAFWVEHLPAHLHLLLSTRVDPDLKLSRLRVRGHLTEIRADELRFRLEEASHYLGQMLAPPLSEEEVRQLALRTEGWIAGLQLAALALEKRADRAAFLQAFTGSQRYLLDYVQEDILARLPTEVRDFLLQIAILSRLDAEVCQAVTAAPTSAASQQMLAFLERANLFLVPLDEERRTYRLHDLFREALGASLRTTHPDLAQVLHRRAARFYEAQGVWAEAIAHRLAAEDYATAARLMEQTVEPFWVHGEAATMAHWVLALPDRLVRDHARLALATALYLLTTVTQTTGEQRERRHHEVRQLMARVETALRRESDETAQDRSAPGAGGGADSPPEALEPRAAEEALLRRRLRLLHLFLGFLEAIASGDPERFLHRRQPEIEALLDQDEEAIWQMVPLFCYFALSYTVRQEGAVLVPRLLEAKERVSRSGSPFAAIRTRQWLTMAAVEAGQLHLAYEESQAALDQIEQLAGYALLKGYFQIVQVEVLYQWNRLAEAHGRLQSVLHDAARWQHLDVRGSGYVWLVEVALASGAWSEAQQALDELEQLVQREHYGYYPDWLPTMRAHWWLAQGRLQEASDWAASIIFPAATWEGSLYDAFPVVIRVYFAKLRWREALALLERWRTHLDRAANIRITITFLAQVLVALHQTGQREQAHRIAERLFALTEPEGYVRVYLDEGEPMRQALLAVLTAHSQPQQQDSSTTAYVSELLAAFEQEGHGASASPEAATTPAPAPSQVQPLSPTSSAPGASLTRREQEVLRLLAEGAANQDIAQTLVISLETVKKHVSHLLGKLGATSRTQAIALARARSLL